MDSTSLKTPPRQLPGGKRELTKTQNRQIILDAARQVFAELGYGAATVRDIIRATPLASGTFYNYFKSKEEVYQAIRDEVALAIRPRLREERVKADSMEDFLRGSFTAYFDYVAREQASYRSLQTGLDNSRLRLDTPQVIAGFEEMREDIEGAIRKGLFPPVDAGLLMAAVVGCALEVAQYMLSRDPPDPAAACDFAYALFVGGIRALPPTAPPPDPSPESAV